MFNTLGPIMLVGVGVVGVGLYFYFGGKNAPKKTSTKRRRAPVCHKVTKGHMEGFLASPKKVANMKRGSSMRAVGVKVGRKADGSYYICD